MSLESYEKEQTRPSLPFSFADTSTRSSPGTVRNKPGFRGRLPRECIVADLPRDWEESMPGDGAVPTGLGRTSAQITVVISGLQTLCDQTISTRNRNLAGTRPESYHTFVP
ncbi:hypothetical protein RRG08_003940 [Elysia crispata]|uniref:Uncharacterized protein n=1 Tax=Elysia crispata TaxID=231223 RepID=A0AAE1CWG8_9GAST|nr:hypothetical protein RRG08_003940 [Elysia crispata]